QEPVKEKVIADLTKERARQKHRYNSKKSTHKIGRAKGSKAKQDTRVKQDTSGFWE
ncbi:hypothetical protein M422DRAFT_125094, partial [Sphaerobolus stellatus SS14]